MKIHSQQNVGRIDFKLGVPENLYKQAGGRCSVPRCKNPTMGPYSDNDGAVNMGVASHIYSASVNGPRGQGGKDNEFISSEKNGIWCCPYHASLIDKNKGGDYPAHALFAWKELAEARVRKQMNDTPSPLGWVESIEFTMFPVLSSLPKIYLSRHTLMWGKPASGKTSILEAAASICNSRFADRFNGTLIRGEDGELYPVTFSAKLLYSTVDVLEKEVCMDITGPKLTRRVNMRSCLLPPGDLEVIYCSESDCRKKDYEDDVDYFMRVLNVDKSTLFALVEIGATTVISGKIDFVHADDYDEENDRKYLKNKENGEPYYNLRFKKENSNFFLSYAGLSGSEKDRLIIDLLITKAREICKERLTLFLIDDIAIGLDKSNFEILLRALAKEDFQSIVSLPPAKKSEIINDTGDILCLNELDYLREWRLSVVAS